MTDVPLLQLFGLLEVECPEVILPQHLLVACLAWGGLGDTAIALDGMRRHEPLAEAWTAEQQQLAFQSMLSALKQKAANDSAVHAAQHVWMIAVSNNLPDRQPQWHELVLVLLRKGRLPVAHKVT